ncbi:MAG: methylated-DNA--[protein]-cysteine S-methyltransferase [Minisyncoccia bacterium]
MKKHPLRGQVHDFFMSIEVMTKEEYENGGKNIDIHFSFNDTPFGRALIASTPEGVLHLAFVDTKARALRELRHRFPRARYIEGTKIMHKNAFAIFKNGTLPKIRLHVKGTPFQLKVWNALLKIPSGHLATYGAIATRIKNPKAHRAVGTAVGANHIAFLIPCHRVVLSRGVLGNYRWGSARKKAVIDWESAR